MCFSLQFGCAGWQPLVLLDPDYLRPPGDYTVAAHCSEGFADASSVVSAAEAVANWHRCLAAKRLM
jgi:hypothetical protein